MAGSVIVSGARTPIGKLSGSLAGFSGAQLGALAIKAALERAGITGEQVDYVYMGQVLLAGAGQMTAMMQGITLSAEQQTKVDTIVAKYRALNAAIPQDDADRRTKMTANTTKRNDEIKAVLTDDQKKVFEKNLADLAARMQGGGRPPQA